MFVSNTPVLMDMVQNNPGDPLGFQSTKYSDPLTLAGLGYDGQVSTGENSPLLTVSTFNSTEVWSDGSPEMAWRDAYAEQLSLWSDRVVQNKLGVFWFTDLMVFPEALVELHEEEMVDVASGKVEYNNFTKGLMREQFAEAFAAYPETRGLIIRTGETYVYDNPYHVGNSPLATVDSGDIEKQQAVWVDFIQFLREEVCEGFGKAVIFRTWDNFDGWSASADYYLNVSNAVEAHPLLYFSIKHTAGDFLRNMDVNHQLGKGKHAQIIEVECQREYEGKGAYPNYVMQGIIDGFPEDADPPVGLRDWIQSPLVVGLWTWSRGGGWWGPYIKDNELWIDFHVQVVTRWWRANIADDDNSDYVSEEEVFAAVCSDIFPSLDTGGCDAVRAILLDSATAVLWGHYCQEGDSSACWTGAMRDDRLGGLAQLGGHFDWMVDNDAVDAGLGFKANATALWRSMRARYDADVGPLISTSSEGRFFATSLDYGRGLFDAVEAGWRAMIFGKLLNQHGLSDFKQPLIDAIGDYDAAWARYSVLSLQPGAPSVYVDTYFNLPGEDPAPGIGDSVNLYRNVTGPMSFILHRPRS